MKRRTGFVACLLLLSGCCALAYQIAWLRELRLVFGASTPASAAVLAIFMGGLGLGGMVLGKYADRHRNPLRLYAQLELLIAGTVMLTPYLLSWTRSMYIAMGGAMSLGIFMATGMRLLLAAMVLALPTFLMGGTMPAAARAVVNESDASRSSLGFLYGANTLGAVIGVSGMTFYMLETFGTRQSLLLSCFLNILVGLLAFLASYAPVVTELEALAGDEQDSQSSIDNRQGPVLYIYGAAGVVGFVFFLMELVWYRMLAPVLGGSTYTFGLILAVALAGIGVGGWFYSLRARHGRPTMYLFSVTCALEALGVALAYGLGDRIAVFAASIRMLAAGGMGGQVLGWLLVTLVVVLPAAIIAGFQFPLLIALLGRGGRDVGRHTGFVYAWNTVGAIFGSLAGGFGIMTILSAPGCWRFSVILLALLGITAAGIALSRDNKITIVVQPLILTAAALFLISATGPTAVWRHNPIGAGRAVSIFNNKNEIKRWKNNLRQFLTWEADGVESSVGLVDSNGLSFYVNGKSDGNAKSDAPTQVMSSMVSAILHPDPKRALVVGLGTGSSAGWLAEVPSIDRVDVVELESVILEVARRCAPVNRNVLENPKVQTIIGDGREVLLTTRETYDLIVSEPSNPYRAGVASLYTLEFYQAVAGRLAEGGFYSQWVQGYEVNTETIRVIYTTLSQAFPFVETWQTMTGDLLFVCSLERKVYNADELRLRVAMEPFRSALLDAWWAVDLEGFLARYVAGPSLARRIAEEEAGRGRINTDDRMLVEFGFARSVGRQRLFAIDDVRRAAEEMDAHRPLISGHVDWPRVVDNMMIMHASLDQQTASGLLRLTQEQKLRGSAYNYYLNGKLSNARNFWQQQSQPPQHPLDLALISEAQATESDEAALASSEAMRQYWPGAADAHLARYYLRKGENELSYEALEAAVLFFRQDPWTPTLIMQRALSIAKSLAKQDKELAVRIFALLAEPFSVKILEEQRLNALLDVSAQLELAYGVTALKQFEPDVPWHESFLRYRHRCYRLTKDPLAGQAEKDLMEFLQNTPTRFILQAGSD